jgi:uncharacterized protein YaaW (UPF0174 family)
MDNMEKRPTKAVTEIDQLKNMLKELEPERLEKIAAIVKAKNPTVGAILEAFSYYGSTMWGKLSGKKRSYEDVVRGAAKTLSISCCGDDAVEEIEFKIAQKCVKIAVEKMTPEERKEFEDKLKRIAQKFGATATIFKDKSIITVLISLTVAQLSGFEVYLLASTSLAFVGHMFGAAFSFFVYTTLSKAIAIIIGPFGWSVLAVGVLAKIFGPDYEKIIQAIIYIFGIKTRLRYLRETVSGILTADDGGIAGV